MKLVQLLDDKVHWVTPYTKSTLPPFAPDMIFIEAPNEVQEGWYWKYEEDGETIKFLNPDDIFCYVNIDNEGYVFGKVHLVESEDKIPISNVVKVDTLFQANTDQIYYDNEFIDFKHYISKRLDKIEQSIKINK